MQIFVKLYSSSRTIVLDVELDYTIFFIKELIYDKEGIVPYIQKLIFKNITLEDDKTLSDYKIESECTIYQNYTLKNI